MLFFRDETCFRTNIFHFFLFFLFDNSPFEKLTREIPGEHFGKNGNHDGDSSARLVI